MTFCTHVSAASAAMTGKNDNSADNPFILPSALITLQPFLLAAILAVKLHVDGRRLHADLRTSGAQDRHQLGFLIGPERAQCCASKRPIFPSGWRWTCATLRVGKPLVDRPS
jgi:hypothetical protein